MGAETLPIPKRSPLCFDAGPLWRSRARGCGVSGANLACVHRHTPRQTSIYFQLVFQISLQKCSHFNIFFTKSQENLLKLLHKSPQYIPKYLQNCLKILSLQISLWKLQSFCSYEQMVEKLNFRRKNHISERNFRKILIHIDIGH